MPEALSARTLSTRAWCTPSAEGRGNVGEKRNGPGDRSPRPLLKSAGSGALRGECGVSHRSYDAAHAHCERDHRDVVRGNGGSAYSDRRPVAS
jgi:hypothetical protein